MKQKIHCSGLLISLANCYHDGHQCDLIVKPGRHTCTCHEQSEPLVELMKFECITDNLGYCLNNSVVNSSSINCLFFKTWPFYNMENKYFCDWTQLFIHSTKQQIPTKSLYPEWRSRFKHQLFKWLSFVFDYSTLVRTNIQSFMYKHNWGRSEGYIYVK